jgi:hypothetical protein
LLRYILKDKCGVEHDELKAADGWLDPDWSKQPRIKSKRASDGKARDKRKRQIRQLGTEYPTGPEYVEIAQAIPHPNLLGVLLGEHASTGIPKHQ